MTAAAYTKDLALITGFESTTSMSAYGGGAAGLGASPDYKIQGTNAVDKQVSAAEKGFMFTGGALTMGPILDNDHYWIWVVCAVPGLVDTRDNRGIHVSIGDDTSNFVKYHVAGGDTRPRGGIAPYAVRHDNTTLTNRRTLVGTPGTAPDSIGGGANVTGTAKFSNFACDFAQIGTGYSVTGGTSPDAAADFDGLNTSVSNPCFSLVDGAFQWQGKIRIGESGTECRFTDSNKSIFVVNTLDGIVKSNLNELVVSDDATVFTLTNVTFTSLGTHSPGRLETLKPIITGQDETSYDNSPSTEGTFNGGTSGYVVGDVIHLSDEYTKVTVDAVSGGVVTQFTVNSTKGRTVAAGTTLTQNSTYTLAGGTGSGTGFTLTPDVDNIVSDYGTITFSNVGFVDFGDTILSSNDSLTGCRWIGCDQVTANGATLTDSTFSGYEGTANTSYLIWDVNSDPDGELDGCSFEKGTAATHAIEFGLNSPTTMTLRDIDFIDYNAADTNNDSTFHFKRTSGTVTLNLVGCTGNFSYRSDGATIDIVQNPVTLTITVLDITTGLPINGARVYVTAEATGPLPYQDSVTITSSGTTATVSHTAHGFTTGERVFIDGANEDPYNGNFAVTVTGPNAYEYTMSTSTTSPATGTITATAVIISGTTNASGVISDTRTYATDQDFAGRVRQSSASPYYKSQPITGTIDSDNGASVTVQMIRDE